MSQDVNKPVYEELASQGQEHGVKSKHFTLRLTLERE